MMRIIDHNSMGKSDHDWLHSIFHFSFAEYYNPKNMQYGALRVVNDDNFDAGNGFDTHSHQNMEIISYVIDGVLTHKDSMGNKRELTRGQVQYMSAGTGVAHSEFNLTTKPLRFLQIWILPDKKGYAPQYGDMQFDWSARENKWLHIVSDVSGVAPIKIHQDMNIYVTSLAAGAVIDYTIAASRQAYLIQIEGNGTLNGQPLRAKDAAKLEGALSICAETTSHYILFDMKK